MPIIKARTEEKTVSVKCKLKESTLNEINDYCSHFGISDQEIFIEEAVEYVLQSDKDWKRVKKQKPKTQAEVIIEKNNA